MPTEAQPIITFDAQHVAEGPRMSITLEVSLDFMREHHGEIAAEWAARKVRDVVMREAAKLEGTTVAQVDVAGLRAQVLGATTFRKVPDLPKS
jgi:hypothetical protein